MKLIVLIIVVLVSMSCSSQRNDKIPQKTSELTKEQKEELKEWYERYRNFVVRPGIPEGVEVKERTEPLPWKETGKEFDPTHLKDWLTNARLDLRMYNVIECTLPLHGVYTGEKQEITDDDEWIVPTENPYEKQFGPIGVFGNMRINLRSCLRSMDGDTVELDHYSNMYITDNPRELYLQLRISSNTNEFDGHMEAELLPPLRWKYVHIPLLPETEGKEYELDGVKFRLLKSSPGDVILEYDKKYAEQMSKMNIIPIKGQKPMRVFVEYIFGYKGILQYYQNPDMGFGEWCVTCLGVNCDSLGAMPKALELAAHPDYLPTEEDIRYFHETAGETVGLQLMESLPDVTLKDYEKLYQKWIKKGYETAVKFDGDYDKAMKYFYSNQENYDAPYVAFFIGVDIGSSYVKADLNPDWKVIDRCATELVEKYSDANADSLRNVVNKHTEIYTDAIVTKREALVFLTDEDISHLSKTMVPDDSPLMYCWYKSNMEADAIYIYWPDASADRPILKVRYPLDGRKADVIYP